MGNTPPSTQQEPYRNNSSNSHTSHTDTSAEGTSISGSQSQSQSQSYYSHQQQQQQQQPPPPPQQRRRQPQKLPTTRMRSFPGSVLLESAMCGSIDHSEDHSRTASSDQERLWKRVDRFGLCAGGSTSFEQGGGGNRGDHSTSTSSPPRRQHSLSEYSEDSSNIVNEQQPPNATSALFARALVSEVTDNPKTMTPADMADREKKLLKAQKAAKNNGQRKDGPRPVGAPGGIGQPNLLGSIAHAITGAANGGTTANDVSQKLPPVTPSSSVLPPNSLQENRAQQQQYGYGGYQPSSGQNATSGAGQTDGGKYSVTIGLSLSRRHSTVGHPDTVTRQTVFDFNELQDRQYKYVSSTDSSGWRAGGGERGGDQSQLASAAENANALVDDFGSASLHPHGVPRGANNSNKNPSSTAAASVSSQSQQPALQFHKVAAPDTVHIPIIQIDADSPQAVDAIINAMARGEIFIPHMAVLPESLSVNGISPPDLVVRFGCERNDDVPPDEWPNWCLEFMHNQLYEYFHNMGARWTKRPFSITLARKVRWKTVKHMNRYFAHAERVIDAWREKGAQYLDPQLSYIEGGATPEEVARPHGIYLLRNGVPTNYFAPNFDPPYTTKMTRSLLLNVLGKSWDKKRREWTIEPIPRLVTPSMLMATMCGCTDPGTGGFMANEVTHVGTSLGNSHISDQRLVTQDQHQQHRSHDGVAAVMGPAPPAPAGIVAATAAPTNGTTPRSNAPSTGDVDQSQGKVRRKQKFQQSQAMHAPTQPSAPPTSQIKSPAGKHQSPMPAHSPPNGTNNEEKKVDDEYRRQGPSEAPGKYMTFRDPHSHQGHPNSAQHSRPNSDFSRSVANSGTMVRHTNNLIASVHSSSIQEKQTIASSSWRKKQGQDGGSGSPQAGTNRSPRHSPSGQGLTNAGSGFSLDYSMDSSNYFTKSPSNAQEEQHSRSAGVGGGSMMMQFAEASQASKQRNTRHVAEQRQKKQEQHQELRLMTVTDYEDLDLQESGSSNEVVPSDEELFAVGWAKAMDPSSGNYYYFTLDRTKTVWENPLSADTFISGESSYLSGSAASSFRQAR